MVHTHHNTRVSKVHLFSLHYFLTMVHFLRRVKGWSVFHSSIFLVNVKAKIRSIFTRSCFYFFLPIFERGIIFLFWREKEIGQFSWIRFKITFDSNFMTSIFSLRLKIVHFILSWCRRMHYFLSSGGSILVIIKPFQTFVCVVIFSRFIC